MELPRTVFWEAVFHGCAPAQQRELFALAHDQGLLYGHQLPPSRNGTPPPVTVPTSQTLAQLVSGPLTDLEPARPADVPASTIPLDSNQRDAVAKALATPDICLVQGLPGTGKSRVGAEILTQTGRRGERVLLLAASAAAVDRVLELLPAHDEVYTLRLLGPEEKPETLPPCSRRLTLPERLRELSSQALRQGKQTCAAHEQRSRRLRQDEPLWNQLREVTDRLEQLHVQTEALVQRRPLLREEVERNAQAVSEEQSASGAFQKGLAVCLRQCQESQTRIDKALVDVKEQSAKHRQEQAQLQARSDTLRPLAEAQREKRWWTGPWWRALFHKGLADEFASLEGQLNQVQTVLEGLEKEEQRLVQEREQAGQAFQTERAERIENEVGRRQTELDNQWAAFLQERNLLQAKWQTACAALSPEGPRPTGQALAEVREAHAAWCRLVERAERETTLLRQWLACLEEPDAWPNRVRTYANVVATTTAALAADPHFESGPGAEPRFDLLVLQDADQVTESEFLALARHARRWVLIGEPAPERCRAAPRKGRGQPLRPLFFDSLWQRFHWEPRSLPYAWVQEGERLCCHLHAVAPDQRQWIETESVADFPDIELRILALPRAQPVLAEVVFPPTLSIEEAKTYVYREVGELAVETAGQNVGWVEEPGRLVFRLADESVPHAVRIPLEAGVCELVGSAPAEGNGQPQAGGVSHWQTCCLEFDRTAGWDRRRAEEWVHQHLGVRDLGRTARLTVPHRMHPHLAAVLSHMLFGGDYRTDGSAGRIDEKTAARVAFLPVPPLRTEGSKGKDSPASTGRGGPPVLPRKGGAGLEIDLTDPRHRTRLPGDLGIDLPSRGFVNYAEAQAVVRTLEAMAANPDAWPGLECGRGEAGRPVVAVLALYPAQVELLRGLVRRSPLLGGHGQGTVAQQGAAPFDVVVEGPAAFREREVAMVLLSLTRSHSHRPITYGEGPELLTLAFTRARSQLVLFGDPGSLARRSQWEGPLDHLDEAAAAREREVVAQLVQYLQGQAPFAEAFHLREGAGP